jgi:hypothetical protein
MTHGLDHSINGFHSPISVLLFRTMAACIRGYNDLDALQPLDPHDRISAGWDRSRNYRKIPMSICHITLVLRS